ncbi:MOSC domain-containing protein [SAR116 cluster bacterium]|nr:MOSC domain-containing protein [SAR116 cluster bacterium]
MIVDELWHFPVKGLGGTTLTSAHLQAGAHFPGDRLFAIANGHARHDQVPAGTWHKKAFFLQLMRFEQLAELECSFDGTEITIHHRGKKVAKANLDSPEGGEQINDFLAGLLGDQIPGAPQVMRISEGAYTDTKAPLISLGGTASVTRFAEMSGTAPDVRRFRLNIMLKTEQPFQEAALIGKTIRLGKAEMHVTASVGRCAAIDVDPATAIRGPHYLPQMEASFGHTDLGIFAEVTRSGEVAPDDRLEILE